MSTKRSGEFYVRHLVHTLLYVGLLIGSSDRQTIISATLKHLKDPRDNSDLLPKVRRALNHAQEYGYVRREQGIYTVTDKGQKRLDRLTFQPLEQRDAWDGKWWLLMFDIPISKNNSRVKLRRLIQQLGFVKLQHSVWLHALPCSNEFQQIQKAYGISSHVRLIACQSKELDTEFFICFLERNIQS